MSQTSQPSRWRDILRSFGLLGTGVLALHAIHAAERAQIPRISLEFDGRTSYAEVPDSPDLSVSSTGALTVSAWMKPDTLSFPRTEGTGYVHWLGKGEDSRQEWVFRMYSAGNTENRENRISFYVFDPVGHLGIGSYFQDAITPGQWIHVVGVADGQSTSIYKNGVPRDTDLYAGSIVPQHGTAPLRLGTRDFNSYFLGGLGTVRLWNRALTATEISNLYNSGIVPQQGLVAELLLKEGRGSLARDTKDSHDGFLSEARWECAPSATDLCQETRVVPFR
jgi:Concanavalin A-like lectin/glucanases superfamily